MVKGSCMCGDFMYEYTGEPGGNAICHCGPCRKNAGTNGSTNTFVSNDKYKQLAGSGKHWSRKGDSGKDVEYTFCATCCTLMYVRPEAMAGMTILKPGTIDDAGVMAHLAPGMEIYTKERTAWVKPTEGAQQKETS